MLISNSAIQQDIQSLFPHPNRVMEYFNFHDQSMQAGDVDPQNPLLQYICDRFELNIEQRFWLAFLTATCYCAPTVFFMYNEFPDWENIDFTRLERWWNENKPALVFQTDCRWIRSRNQFVGVVKSYTDIVGPSGQLRRYHDFQGSTPQETYRNAFSTFSKVKWFGRFRMFVYLEAVKVTTGFNLLPSDLDLANAESSRNGLCYALGQDDMMNHFDKRKIKPSEIQLLDEEFSKLSGLIQKYRPSDNIWNIETTLCAYKKYKIKKRWVGYYLERQAKEIRALEERVVNGVDWSVLWQFRRETFDNNLLSELSIDKKKHKYSNYWEL
jgi:hypothetical protein